MDKYTDESTKQSIQEDDTEESSPVFEPTILIPVTEDTDPDDRTVQETNEETHLSEFESKNEHEVVNVSTALYQGEFIDVEVSDSSKDNENSPFQFAIKCESNISEKNSNSKICSSNLIDARMESGSDAAVDVPTHQASETSISTSNSISNALPQSSDPIAIPSTSRDSSGLAEGSSPKRPTNFGSNVKQAVHVFHPRSSTSILQRFPVPIHRGRWVYLRDSPESSDYGGSPDSLDDPFLMEALDVKTPENEMEDSDTLRNESLMCSPPVSEMVGTESPSESGQVEDETGHIETATEDIQSEPSYIETTGDLPSDSSRIGSLPFESGHIKVKIEDERSESSQIEETITHSPYELDYTETTVGDIPSESSGIKCNKVDEPYESGHIEMNIENLTSELGSTVNSIEVKPSESGQIKMVPEDIPSESINIESNLQTERGQNTYVNLTVGISPIQRSVGELQSQLGHIEESLNDLHCRILQSADSVGIFPPESENSETSIGDLGSDSEQYKRNIEDLPPQ